MKNLWGNRGKSQDFGRSRRDFGGLHRRSLPSPRRFAAGTGAVLGTGDVEYRRSDGLRLSQQAPPRGRLRLGRVVILAADPRHRGAILARPRAIVVGEGTRQLDRESFSDDWYVVSAPSRSAESYSGKARWLKAFFGNRFDRFALTAHKHLLANPNTILIDDREQNVTRFLAAGGVGIMFPCRYNSYHEVTDPVSHIQSVLELLCT